MDKETPKALPKSRMFDAQSKVNYIMLQMDNLYSRLDWCTMAGKAFQGEADMIVEWIRYLDQRKQQFKKYLQSH